MKNNKSFRRCVALLCALGAFLLISPAATAQTDITAAFTDANFRAEVRTALGKAADAPIYDTDNFAAVTELNVSNKNIASLAGLEYFTALTQLYCYGNSLTSLPALPATLTLLDCGENRLTSLPTLPDALTYYLHCYNTQLTSLPALPAALTRLSCGNNQLTSLPALPDALIYLYCRNNSLTNITLNSNARYEYIDVRNNYLPGTTSITGFTGTWDTGDNFLFTPQRTAQADITAAFTDANFRAEVRTALGKAADAPIYDTDNFAAVTELNVSNKNIASLAGLEYFTALTQLYCYGNSLTSLPALPATLTLLDCGENRLTSLPTLPDALTYYLHCYNTQLTSLPALPAALTRLSCGNNQLTSLPALPDALIYLYCRNNSLTNITLNSNARYEYIDVRNNYLPGTTGITGFSGTWDTGDNFLFTPQRTGTATESPASTALRATATGEGLWLTGLTPGTPVAVYNLLGQLISAESARATGQSITLKKRGVYIITNAGNRIKAVFN